ncbi:MAG: YjbQ family protein [Anaerolineales bacterium]|nr:YjbQ family protein [Anaerolineales bacterium]
MPVTTTTISLETRGNADMHNLTGALTAAIQESGLQNGTLTIFCPSSTSAVTTIEYEPGALADLRRLFDQLAPQGHDYAHEAAWGDGNGHSHLRAALLGPSLTVPLVDGHLTLGTWQQVLYIDFDIRPRQRQLVVQIVGE